MNKTFKLKSLFTLVVLAVTSFIAAFAMTLGVSGAKDVFAATTVGADGVNEYSAKFYDNFDDGVLRDNWTDISGEKYVDGKWNFGEDKAVVFGDGVNEDYGKMVYDTGATEYVMEVDVKLASDSNTNKLVPFIITESKAGSAFYGVALNFSNTQVSVFYTDGTNAVALTKSTSAQYKCVYSWHPDYTSAWLDSYHTYRCEVSERGIFIYVDGVMTMSFDRYYSGALEFTRGATMCGIGANCAASVGLNAMHYDNFKVWTKSGSYSVLEKAFDMDFEGETARSIAKGTTTVDGQGMTFGTANYSIVKDEAENNTFLRWTSVNNAVEYCSFASPASSGNYVLSFKTRLNPDKKTVTGVYCRARTYLRRQRRKV